MPDFTLQSNIIFLFPKWKAVLAALVLRAVHDRLPSPSPSPANAAVPEVATVTVAPQRVALTTELPGRTSPYRIAEIRPQVNGLIQKRLFTEGVGCPGRPGALPD